MNAGGLGMLRRWRDYELVVFFAMVCLLVVGGGQLMAAQSDSTAEDQVLRVGLAAGDVGRLDPHVTSLAQDYPALESLFNGLVRFKPDRVSFVEVEPDLAVSWEVSEDGREWVFHLREGVQWHGGYGEVTSEDVVYSFNRAKDPAISAWANDYTNFRAVEAIDRYTVRMVLDEIDPYWLGKVANYHGGFVVCKAAIEELGDADYALNPIGSGPFMFSEYLSKTSLTLVRNTDYFRGEPLVSTLVFHYMPDPTSRRAAFVQGFLDTMDGEWDQIWLDEVVNASDGVLDLIAPPRFVLLTFNMSMPPLDDIRVREALALAIDRSLLTVYFGEGISTPLYSPVPMSYFGGVEDVNRLEYGPATARSLLRDAGYADGFELSMFISERSDYVETMEIIQAMWAEIGVKLELKVVDHTAYHSRIREDENPVVLYSCSRKPTADEPLTQFFHSASIVGKESAITNFSHFSDPEVDEAIEQARVTLDSQEQLSLYAFAQRRIMEAVAAKPLITIFTPVLRHAWVQFGHEPGSSMTYNYHFDETVAVAEH
jgi:peptide/nickel transport system substrate-binding protein